MVELLGAGEIRSLASQLDLRPTKKLGQNFVIDPNTIRKIVAASQLQPKDKVVETLLRVGAPKRVVFHCYSGDLELAKICAKHGWYTSFAGNITIKRNQHLRDSLKFMPTEKILVETDAPFLTPEPLRGRPNAPYLVPITVRFMAAELGLDADELSGQLAKNTVAVYGSWGN